MFTLTQTEAADLLSAIELAWAKPVVDAFHKDDNHGDEHSFYILDGKVYYILWMASNTVSLYYEVTGEDLEIFKTIYKLWEA